MSESKIHKALKKKAINILLANGFKQEDIHLEYSIQNLRVDVAGVNQHRCIAIECGNTNPKKLMELEEFFDEVIHLPYIRPIRMNAGIGGRPRTKPINRPKATMIKCDWNTMEEKEKWIRITKDIDKPNNRERILFLINFYLITNEGI